MPEHRTANEAYWLGYFYKEDIRFISCLHLLVKPDITQTH